MTISLLSQNVNINLAPYFVSNLNIDVALGAVPTITFAVDGPANAGRPRPRIGDLVEVFQSCDGVQSYRAWITGIEARRAKGAFELRVTALGAERYAALTRKYRVLNEAPLGDQFRDVVTFEIDGLNNFGDVPAPGQGPIMPEHTLNYASVSDYLDWVQRAVGWFWRIDENGLFHLFDPTDLSANPAQAVNFADFEDESASVNVNMTVINVARKQAWYRRTFTARGQQESLFQTCIRSIQVPPDAPTDDSSLWELESAELIQGQSWPDDTPREDVALRIADGIIEFDPPLRVTPLPVVRLTFRLLVWTQRQDAASIAEYGRREGPPLPHDGEQGVEEAHVELAQYLQSKALPEVTLEGIFMRSDIAPGDVLEVDLPELSQPRTFLVSRVRRTTEGMELRVRFDAKTLGEDVTNPEDPPKIVMINPSPVHEIVRRTTNLELRNLNPRTLVGQIASRTGPIPPRGTAPAGAFSLSTTFEVLPISLEQNSAIGYMVLFEAEIVNPNDLVLCLDENTAVVGASDQLVLKEL